MFCIFFEYFVDKFGRWRGEISRKRVGRLLEKLNFQAVINSAASAASPTAWELHGSARPTGNGGTTRTAGRRIGSGDGFGARSHAASGRAPMQIPSRRGGCASSRLDHGLMNHYIKGPKKKGSKRQFFDYFLAFFPYIWPVAGPNIAKKGRFVAKIGEGGSTNPFWNF